MIWKKKFHQISLTNKQFIRNRTHLLRPLLQPLAEHQWAYRFLRHQLPVTELSIHDFRTIYWPSHNPLSKEQNNSGSNVFISLVAIWFQQSQSKILYQPDPAPITMKSYSWLNLTVSAIGSCINSNENWARPFLANKFNIKSTNEKTVFTNIFNNENYWKRNECN